MNKIDAYNFLNSKYELQKSLFDKEMKEAKKLQKKQDYKNCSYAFARASESLDLMSSYLYALSCDQYYHIETREDYDYAMSRVMPFPSKEYLCVMASVLFFSSNEELVDMVKEGFEFKVCYI